MLIESFLTDRLQAERITPDHFGDLCRLYNDPEVMRTLSADGRILPDEETQRRLAQAVEHWERHGFGLWVFRDRTEGRFVGRGGLKLDWIDGREENGLAYAVGSEQWGKGLATEMAEAILAIGFERLELPEIAAWTLPHNRASLRVMEKLGFRFERNIEFAGLPHRFHRLLRPDWRGWSLHSCPAGQS